MARGVGRGRQVKETVVSLFVDEPQRFRPAAHTNGMACLAKCRELGIDEKAELPSSIASGSAF
jgi:hypothetical protein